MTFRIGRAYNFDAVLCRDCSKPLDKAVIALADAINADGHCWVAQYFMCLDCTEKLGSELKRTVTQMRKEAKEGSV